MDGTDVKKCKWAGWIALLEKEMARREDEEREKFDDDASNASEDASEEDAGLPFMDDVASAYVDEASEARM